MYRLVAFGGALTATVLLAVQHDAGAQITQSGGVNQNLTVPPPQFTGLIEIGSGADGSVTMDNSFGINLLTDPTSATIIRVGTDTGQGELDVLNGSSISMASRPGGGGSRPSAPSARRARSSSTTAQAAATP